MIEAVNLAVLGNSTTDYIASAIQEQCAKEGIPTNMYNCPYNQYNQMILDTSSPLYASSPEMIFFSLEGSILFPKWYDFGTLQLSKEDKLAELQKVFNSIVAMVEEIHSRCGAKIILNNFRLPYHSPCGILDNRSSLGLKRMINQLNLQLEDWACANEYLYIFDYNGLCAQYGNKNIEEKKIYYIAKVITSISFSKILAKEYMRYILPLKSKNRKCLVLDLDNTLWGGVAGEDGLTGIKLDISGTGRSFYDFQNEIANLYRRGIILAVNSKNNFDDAIEIMENHPYMILRKEYFSCLKINWNDKVHNLEEIAKELNIGIDSLVFFDDNPVERDFVKSVLPQVKVVEVPSDTSKYIGALQECVDFEQLNLTEEDIKRNEMYLANQKRLELEQQYKNLHEYLTNLQTEITIAGANKYTLPRIAQLTQKTNQFNMTTMRYQQQDLEKMLASGQYLIFSCSARDRYGDNGLVGVCIVKLEASEAYIDTFLLSCRVLGRNIEYSFVASVAELLCQLKAYRISAKFIETEKNKVNASFYKNAGFDMISQKGSQILFQLLPGNKLKNFEYIKVIMDRGD